MHVYLRNYQKVSDFYINNSQLSDSEKFNGIKTLMKDPDATDHELYEQKANQLKGLNLIVKGTSIILDDYTLGMDCVIGWKALYKIQKGNQRWLNDYVEIRGNLNSHLLWPRSGPNTINTIRYRVFNDRIDHTLQDIKLFYDFIKENDVVGYDDFIHKTISQEHYFVMTAAYTNEKTFCWLMTFGSFESLVDQMKLQWLCNDSYMVSDLREPSSILSGPVNKNLKTVDTVYLENLKVALK